MKNIHFLPIATTDQKDSELDGNQIRGHNFKIKYHINYNRQLVITIQNEREMVLGLKKEYLMDYGKDHKEGIQKLERRRA
jgi:hypothetical protein